MARLTNKKINKARETYKIYCKVNTLNKTKEATGLAINTIRKYIALIEEMDSKSKLSLRDRYYNTEDTKDIYIHKDNIYKDKDNKIYNNTEDNIKEDINNNNIDKDINNVEVDNNDIEVITNSNIPSLKDTKNKILLSKLNTISTKYLDYLDDPSDDRLAKTSLKDRAVIAGILLDKKILLEHKQADVIRNQSIIFNLFGDNKNLASFISDAVGRQKRLSAKPTKKYVLAGVKQ